MMQALPWRTMTTGALLRSYLRRWDTMTPDQQRLAAVRIAALRRLLEQEHEALIARRVQEAGAANDA